MNPSVELTLKICGVGVSDWLEFETKKYSGRTVFERHTIATNEIMGCACELCDSTDLSMIGTRSANKNIVADLETRSSSIESAIS